MKKSFAAFAVVLALSGIFYSAPGRAENALSLQKLDEISKKQDQILSELAEIKEELHIVKIRASQGI